MFSLTISKVWKKTDFTKLIDKNRDICLRFDRSVSRMSKGAWACALNWSQQAHGEAPGDDVEGLSITYCASTIEEYLAIVKARPYVPLGNSGLVD